VPFISIRAEGFFYFFSDEQGFFGHIHFEEHAESNGFYRLWSGCNNPLFYSK
tara:strand:+ start:452 stop:607 length:156 start_codon:yes stop_codon:yes gene_type:complete